MQRYESVFKESKKDVVSSKTEAQQIVDISNLEWGETFISGFTSAKLNAPSGWRLPTIQELYTAYVKNVPGFKKDVYWSSTLSVHKGYAYAVNFYNGDATYYNHVMFARYNRYVK